MPSSAARGAGRGGDPGGEGNHLAEAGRRVTGFKGDRAQVLDQLGARHGYHNYLSRRPLRRPSRRHRNQECQTGFPLDRIPIGYHHLFDLRE